MFRYEIDGIEIDANANFYAILKEYVYSHHILYAKIERYDGVCANPVHIIYICAPEHAEILDKIYNDTEQNTWATFIVSDRERYTAEKLDMWKHHKMLDKFMR